jgi:4-amino-4-deoxy-L-arabinose transferase-like glycosyltransferase
LFLICVVLVLTGMLLRRRIKALWYWILFFVLLIPTTINETKVTVIFVPLGLVLTLLLAAERGKKLKYLLTATAGLFVAGALFVPIYNFTQANNPYKNERDIMEFFSNEKQLSRYMSTNAGVGTNKDVRRGDAIVVPFEFLAQDPVRLMFGLGIGAVSPSNLGKSFEGPYYLLFKRFLIISFTFFLLEFGIFGVIVIAVLFWMQFRDTLAVSKKDSSIVGALAAGWTGVVVIFAVDVIYTIFHEFVSITYLYWYLSGLICARCVALATGRRHRSPSRGRALHNATEHSRSEAPAAVRARYDQGSE